MKFSAAACHPFSSIAEQKANADEAGQGLLSPQRDVPKEARPHCKEVRTTMLSLSGGVAITAVV
jgi:hypothetical protein